MEIWLLAIFLGALAGFLIPLSWYIFQALQEKFMAIFIVDINTGAHASLLSNMTYPALVVAAIFTLFMIARTYRSADGFTYFISDLHFNDGRRKIAYSFVHGLAAFMLAVGGGVVGIEAFSIEFLTALGGKLGAKAQLSTKQVRTLSACGLTATLAAVLGQPATALLFTIELLYGWSGAASTIGPFAITAFVAASMSKTLTSPTSFFRSLAETDGGLSSAIRGETFAMDGINALFSVLVVGASAAVFAAFAIWLFRKTDKELHALFSTRRAVDVSPKAFGLRLLMWGIITGLVYYYFGDVLGTGVQILHLTLSQSFLVKSAFLVLLMRLLLGVLSYSVLGSIGLILPTLVMGGILGSSLALLFHSFVSTSTATYALLGMGAFFSAAFGTPVAATALVYGYAGGVVSENAMFLFTSIGANFVAHFFCAWLQEDRMGSMGLYRHGIRFHNGMCFNTLSSIKVKDAMLSWITPIPKNSSIGEAYKFLMDSRFLKLPVVEPEGKLAGMISLSDFYGLETWRKLGEASQVHNLVGITELMKPAFTELEPEMSLEEALKTMSDEDLAPVVEAGKFSGILLKSDLVNLYNKEVVKKAFRR